MQRESNYDSQQKQSSIRLAELDKKIQFIYEIAFAKREISSFGAKIGMKLKDTIQFEITSQIDSKTEEMLLKRLAYFEKVSGKSTEYSQIIVKNQTRSDNQYLTHWYYPYKGKYHPRLIRSIFNIIKLEFGQTILDPFLGSGTTSLEARLFGLNSIGFDISPVCIIISKVKLTAGEVARQLPLYKKEAIDSINSDHGINFALVEGNQKTVSHYSKFLSQIEDERIRNFYLLASLIYASDRGRRNRKIDSFEKRLDKMISSALDLALVEKEFERNNDPSMRKLGKFQIEQSDSRYLNLPDEKVDAIITSPPYSIALNYMENDRHALQELGVSIKDLSNECIGVKGTLNSKLRLYEEDMQSCYSEMYRVLKRNKYCVVVIGNAIINGNSTETVDKTIKYCTRLGFSLTKNIPKKIFGLYNTMIDESVLFFQKSAEK
ncbi:DNA methyltransferase [Candidatus Nitrosocosmicus hydrocola]|uniref:DNA methyltransferase n=1 Tax=Candidatus Nitrosocosmicus hydrocola TaxID=1826872 RepID=UPI0011E595C2|nr:DNA methyltransferase [Candidatus Nitrosocosmicus hydrocola]